MTLLQSVILGAVQGLTEFLPVSSDGHLALFRHYLGVRAENALPLDVAMHAGTLAAMAWFFRRDIRGLFSSLRGPSAASEEAADNRRRFLFIVLATVVTGAVGLGLKGSVERYNAFLPAAGVGFLATTAFLLAGILGGNSRVVYPLKEVPLWHPLLLGLAQGAAVWPGLSRSGSTLGVALLLGWGWAESSRFIFLMAFPALAGALLLTARDMAALPDPGVVLAGVLVSFAAGLGALSLLMRFLAARRLWPFAVYTAALFLLCMLS